MVYQNSRNGFVKSLNNSFMNNADVKQHVQRKQQLNQRSQNQKPMRGQDLAAFNEAVRELCSMYDAVNYFGNSDYAKKNGWREINKEQLNTATIYAIRYAPVVPKRSASSKRQQGRQQNQKQQNQRQQQPQQQYKRQQQQQQPRQNNRRQSGRRIGGCPYKPNVPRVYSYNTTPLPNDLYPSVNNFNHLYEAFNYFGNSQVRNVKSWIESSRTHKLNSIASVFAKRNAPYVPVRQYRSNKKNQPQQQKKTTIPKETTTTRNCSKTTIKQKTKQKTTKETND